MPFKHSCFISYRHGPGKFIPKIAEELYQAFTDELGWQLGGMDVFVDKKRLEPGFLFNPAIATAVCQSVCMVVAYWPGYFDINHTYCAREFLAMEQLEAERLKHVSGAEQNKGLIIPIAFRGLGRLPAAIKGHRQAADWSAASMYSQNPIRNSEFEPKIKAVASYICDRYEALKDSGVDHCAKCLGYELPGDDEIQHLVGGATKSDPGFPLSDHRPGAAL